MHCHTYTVVNSVGNPELHSEPTQFAFAASKPQLLHLVCAIQPSAISPITPLHAPGIVAPRMHQDDKLRSTAQLNSLHISTSAWRPLPVQLIFEFNLAACALPQRPVTELHIVHSMFAPHNTMKQNSPCVWNMIDITSLESNRFIFFAAKCCTRLHV